MGGIERRRLIGLLALVVAATVVIVLHGVRVDEQQGTAAAEPVADPPTVGECLVQRPPAASRYPDSPPAFWELGQCGDTVYGEVTAVITSPDDPSSWPHADETPTWTVGSAELSCRRAAQDWIGIWKPTGTVLDWTLAVDQASAVVQPMPRQRAAGQTWQACVVHSQIHQNASDYVTPPLVGSYADAVTTGDMRDALGFCASTAPSGFRISAEFRVPPRTHSKLSRTGSPVGRR